jgi:hypothetical protein
MLEKVGSTHPRLRNSRRLCVVERLDQLATCNLIVEAIVEKLDVKSSFAELETYVERKCGAGIQHLFAFCHAYRLAGYEASRSVLDIISSIRLR